MNQNCVYAQKERNSLEKYIKFFASKVVQAVVQSRTAVMKKSRSKANSTSYDWFNVAIEDEPSISEMTNRALAGQRLLSDFSMCVEIQLQTVEDACLVLETWCLSLKEQYEASARMSSVYPRMCVLLKSIVCVSRVSPAYKLAIRQSPDSYRLRYKIYFGPPQVDILGEGHQEHKIGQVVTPFGSLNMSLAYRTKMTITPQKIEKSNTFMVKSDYFKPDMSPKKGQPPVGMNGFHPDNNHLVKEANILSPAKDPIKPLVNGCVKKSPFSLADSDQENISGGFKGSNGVSEDFIVPGAFAMSSKFPDLSSFPDLILPEKPILNICSGPCDFVVDEEEEQEEDKEESSDDPDRNANLCVDDNKRNSLPGDLDYNCNAKCGNAAHCSGSMECDEDFVMVELVNRPPFASCDSNSDLCAFFRECKCAPPLASFASQPSLEEQVTDITSQLAKFETSMHDFDSFVDSICQIDIQK